VPAQPTPPTIVSADTTQITIAWVAADGRGQAITLYEVYWDAGLGGSPNTLLVSTASNVLTASSTSKIADLTDGSTYNFAVRAMNSLGYSPLSTSAPFVAASVPLKTPLPTIVTASSSSI